MGIKMGVCGLGNFASHFITLFQAHPDIEEIVIADLQPDVVRAKAEEFGIARTCASLDELCATDCDCIGIFTQRWLHGRHSIQALRAGKHVFSAVPAAVDLEDLQELVATVEETGLTYMMAETSYYRPQTIYCRQRFQQGDFGRFVYGEGQYHHDMSHFYGAFMRGNPDNWRATASCPPILYPTHSASHILAVTFRRFTSVSCLGMVDHHEDGIYDPELSLWQNRFSNQTGLFRSSDGGCARINEFRRIGAGESRMTIIGTEGAYEEQTDSGIWTRKQYSDDYHKANGEIDYENAKDNVKLEKEDVSDLRRTSGVTITEDNLGQLPREYLGREHIGVSYIHPVERLPASFVGLPNGHRGSHQLLLVDFLEAVQQNRLPPNHVWQAARVTAPGIVAHESSKRDGERLPIPDFGMPPADAAVLPHVLPLQP